MLTSIDVKFPSSTAYFSSSSEDILQTLFFISVFFILFSFNLIKVLKILLYVSLQRVTNCPVSGLYFDSHRIHELCVFSSRLSFTVSMFIAHATELVHRSTSMYQRPCPFRTSDYCFTMLVFRMISATVIGLSLESDIIFSQFFFFFFTILETFLHQRHLSYKFKKGTKNIGCCMDTTGYS